MLHEFSKILRTQCFVDLMYILDAEQVLSGFLNDLGYHFVIDHGWPTELIV